MSDSTHEEQEVEEKWFTIYFTKYEVKFGLLTESYSFVCVKAADVIVAFGFFMYYLSREAKKIGGPIYASYMGKCGNMIICPYRDGTVPKQLLHEIAHYVESQNLE
jgi:hypothetical protein